MGEKKNKRDISLGNMIGGNFLFDLDAIGIDEILEEEVKPFGASGGHITIRGKHTGKRARVIIYKREGKDGTAKK